MDSIDKLAIAIEGNRCRQPACIFGVPNPYLAYELDRMAAEIILQIIDATAHTIKSGTL